MRFLAHPAAVTQVVSTAMPQSAHYLVHGTTDQNILGTSLWKG
ncbi:MAG TPA: hypothetical protein VFH15_05640 [Pyrinomonadaceae bacterium]|nr:hypothetical protein [Pyrinomonadaceae bacterium]